jgi:hypothetical protein
MWQQLHVHKIQEETLAATAENVLANALVDKKQAVIKFYNLLETGKRLFTHFPAHLFQALVECLGPTMCRKLIKLDPLLQDYRNLHNKNKEQKKQTKKTVAEDISTTTHPKYDMKTDDDDNLFNYFFFDAAVTFLKYALLDWKTNNKMYMGDIVTACETDKRIHHPRCALPILGIDDDLLRKTEDPQVILLALCKDEIGHITLGLSHWKKRQHQGILTPTTEDCITFRQTLRLTSSYILRNINSGLTTAFPNAMDQNNCFQIRGSAKSASTTISSSNQSVTCVKSSTSNRHPYDNDTEVKNNDIWHQLMLQRLERSKNIYVQLLKTGGSRVLRDHAKTVIARYNEEIKMKHELLNQKASGVESRRGTLTAYHISRQKFCSAIKDSMIGYTPTLTQKQKTQGTDQLKIHTRHQLQSRLDRTVGGIMLMLDQHLSSNSFTNVRDYVTFFIACTNKAFITLDKNIVRDLWHVCPPMADFMLKTDRKLNAVTINFYEKSNANSAVNISFKHTLNWGLKDGLLQQFLNTFESDGGNPLTVNDYLAFCLYLSPRMTGIIPKNSGDIVWRFNGKIKDPKKMGKHKDAQPTKQQPDVPLMTNNYPVSGVDTSNRMDHGLQKLNWNWLEMSKDQIGVTLDSVLQRLNERTCTAKKRHDLLYILRDYNHYISEHKPGALSHPVLLTHLEDNHPVKPGTKKDGNPLLNNNKINLHSFEKLKQIFSETVMATISYDVGQYFVQAHDVLRQASKINTHPTRKRQADPQSHEHHICHPAILLFIRPKLLTNPQTLRCEIENYSRADRGSSNALTTKDKIFQLVTETEAQVFHIYVLMRLIYGKIMGKSYSYDNINKVFYLLENDVSKPTTSSVTTVSRTDFQILCITNPDHSTTHIKYLDSLTEYITFLQTCTENIFYQNLGALVYGYENSFTKSIGSHTSVKYPWYSISSTQTQKVDIKREWNITWVYNIPNGTKDINLSHKRHLKVSCSRVATQIHDFQHSHQIYVKMIKSKVKNKFKPTIYLVNGLENTCQLIPLGCWYTVKPPILGYRLTALGAKNGNVFKIIWRPNYGVQTPFQRVCAKQAFNIKNQLQQFCPPQTYAKESDLDLVKNLLVLIETLSSTQRLYNNPSKNLCLLLLENPLNKLVKNPCTTSSKRLGVTLPPIYMNYDGVYDIVFVTLIFIIILSHPTFKNLNENFVTRSGIFLKALLRQDPKSIVYPLAHDVILSLKYNVVDNFDEAIMSQNCASVMILVIRFIKNFRAIKNEDATCKTRLFKTPYEHFIRSLKQFYSTNVKQIDVIKQDMFLCNV